jgi:hypothetical protein
MSKISSLFNMLITYIIVSHNLKIVFGCITADGYSSSENSECENRNIKYFDKPNDLPVAQ